MQFVQPSPDGLVLLQAQHTLETQSAGAVLLGSHPPHGVKPQLQRGARILKNSSAVTEVWCPQPTHCSNTTRTGQHFPPPQRGHRKPSGHRSRYRYCRQASSVANRASSSADTPPSPHTTYWGYLSQAHMSSLL